MMATCCLCTYHPSCMLYGFMSPHPIEIWLSLLSLQWKLFSLNINNFELLKQFSTPFSVSIHPVWRVWYWKLKITLYFLKLSHPRLLNQVFKLADRRQSIWVGQRRNHALYAHSVSRYCARQFACITTFNFTKIMNYILLIAILLMKTLKCREVVKHPTLIVANKWLEWNLNMGQSNNKTEASSN